MNRERLSDIANICIIVASAVLFGWLILGSLVGAFLPFVAAYIIALIVRRPAAFISRKSGIPIGVISAVLVCAFIVGICAAGWLCLVKLMNEAALFLERFASGGNGIAGAIGDIISKTKSVTSLIPALEKLDRSEELTRICKGIDDFVHTSVNDFLKKISSDIGDFFAAVLRSLPEIFLYVLVTLIASVYICSGMDRVNSLLIGFVPKRYRAHVINLKARICAALKAYFNGYSLIYLITFAELWLGFSVMRKRNGLILALIIAAVDILPVFGVGIVLVPWSLAELTAGNTETFATLAVLYVIITAVRQLAEPKIIGKSIGLDPLLTLIAMFVGYKLFGVFGMIFLPIVAVAIAGGKKLDSGEKSE